MFDDLPDSPGAREETRGSIRNVALLFLVFALGVLLASAVFAFLTKGPTP